MHTTWMPPMSGQSSRSRTSAKWSRTFVSKCSQTIRPTWARQSGGLASRRRVEVDQLDRFGRHRDLDVIAVAHGVAADLEGGGRLDLDAHALDEVVEEA